LKQFVSQDVQANNSRRAFERQEYSQNTMTPSVGLIGVLDEAVRYFECV